MLLLSLVRCYHWDRFLKKNIERFNCFNSLVTLFDVMPEEYILTNIFKTFNKKTITLQHGHFMEQKWISDSSFATGFAYRFSTADYFFAWGKMSRDYAIKCGLSPENVVVAGCPKYIGYSFKKECAPKVCNAFGIILEGGNGEDIANHNKLLVEMASKLSYKNNYSLYIKPHPSWQIDASKLGIDMCNHKIHVLNSSTSIEEYCKLVDFSIASPDPSVFASPATVAE